MMTTPIGPLDVPMPFSAELRATAGSGDFQIEPGHRNHSGGGSSIRLLIPSGVSTVQMGWDGEGEARANFGDQTGATPVYRYSVAVLPAKAGGGYRSTVFTVSAPHPGTYLWFTTPNLTTRRDTDRLSVIVTTIPPAGTI